MNAELSLPKTWKDVNIIKSMNTEKSRLMILVNKINKIDYELKELVDILKLEDKHTEKKILDNFLYEINKIEKSVYKLEINSMFLKKNDHLNCYVDIQSGSGGIEAQDWAKMLLRMYLKWSELKGFKTEIIEKSDGDIAGIKSATVKVLGKYAFGWFRTETGIHRLVRKSPFNSNHRRHTSFASIFVYPMLDESISMQLNNCDLRIDVYRSSGAGGQHVNKTESAVRIKHLPTGLIVQCQSNRSQHKNRDQAIKQLKSKLYEKKINEQKYEKKTLDLNKSDIGWSNQIRSYVLDDSRVKDLRTGIESTNIQSILDGELDLFVESSLKIGL